MVEIILEPIMGLSWTGPSKTIRFVPNASVSDAVVMQLKTEEH